MIKKTKSKTNNVWIMLFQVWSPKLPKEATIVVSFPFKCIRAGWGTKSRPEKSTTAHV